MVPWLVGTNIRPSFTISGAFDTCRSGRSTTHAPPSCFTLPALTCESVEYRVLPQSPPGAAQSFPEYGSLPAALPTDRSDAAVSAATAPAATANHQPAR